MEAFFVVVLALVILGMAGWAVAASRTVLALAESDRNPGER